MVLESFNKLKKKHQVIFSVLIAFAVISVWRGIWGLMDEYLLPNHYQLSLVVSLVVGMGILVYTHFAIKELM